MQVPDAVYHLMRHTALKGCNLSSNVITKIPPKFAVKFSLITGESISCQSRCKLSSSTDVQLSQFPHAVAFS